METIKKAILYLRFSDPSQIGNTSLETQEKVCRSACDNEGFEIIEIVKNEAVSANKNKAQRIIELLDFCKVRKGKFDVLMVYKLDRFARGQEQHHWLRGQLLKLGIVLRSATEKIDETGAGKLVEGILAAVNEYDNDIKSERVKLALAARREQGLWPSIPPVGYKTNHIEGIKLSPHILDDKCAGYVKDIFTSYSSGAVTMSELSEEFGKKMIHNYKDKLLRFSKQSIENMLINPYYAGLIKTKEGKLIKGQHQPLIDFLLLEKCQNIKNGLSNHATRKRLYNNPDFPLRRFVLCGSCGKPLTGCWAKSEFPYYYCRNKQCPRYSQMIKRANLENEFMDYLKTIKPSKSLTERFKKNFIENYKTREQEIRGDYLRQIDDVKRLEGEREWLIDKGKKGILPDETLKKELDGVEEKISIAKMELTDTHAEELDVNALLQYALDFIQTIEKSWFEAPSEAKLILQRLVFPEGVVYRFPSFSNSKIAPIFEQISSFVPLQSSLVTPSGFEPELPG